MNVSGGSILLPFFRGTGRCSKTSTPFPPRRDWEDLIFFLAVPPHSPDIISPFSGVAVRTLPPSLLISYVKRRDRCFSHFQMTIAFFRSPCLLIKKRFSPQRARRVVSPSPLPTNVVRHPGLLLLSPSSFYQGSANCRRKRERCKHFFLQMGCLDNPLSSPSPSYFPFAAYRRKIRSPIFFFSPFFSRAISPQPYGRDTLALNLTRSSWPFFSIPHFL